MNIPEELVFLLYGALALFVGPYFIGSLGSPNPKLWYWNAALLLVLCAYGLAALVVLFVSVPFGLAMFLAFCMGWCKLDDRWVSEREWRFIERKREGK